MRGQAAWIWLFPFQSCLAVGACRHSQNTGPQIVDVHNRCIHFLACIEPDVFPRRCFVKAKMGAVLSILCGLIAFVINRIFSKGTGFHGNSDPDRLFCAHKNLQWNEIFQLILRYTQVFVVRCESFRSVCHFSAGVPPLYIDLFGSQLQHQQKQDVFHCELWGKDPVEPKTPIIGLGGNEWWLIGVSYQIGRDKIGNATEICRKAISSGKCLRVPGITVRHVDADDSQAFGRTLEDIMCEDASTKQCKGNQASNVARLIRS